MRMRGWLCPFLQSNWLMGFMLIFAYVIVSTGFFIHKVLADAYSTSSLFYA